VTDEETTIEMDRVAALERELDDLKTRVGAKADKPACRRSG
jgi:hypothetical protein